MSGSAKKKCCCPEEPAVCSDLSTCAETLQIEIHNLIFTDPQGNQCVVETDSTGPILLDNTGCPPFFPNVYLGVDSKSCEIVLTWLILCASTNPPVWVASASVQFPPGCFIQGTDVKATATYHNFSGPLCPPFTPFGLASTDVDPGWTVDAPPTLVIIP